jgi:hypothetical protein
MILNLTQHLATPEQIEAGVVDLPAEMRDRLVEALTFNELPAPEEILGRAAQLAELAVSYCDKSGPYPPDAMIGGAMWLMGPLALELRLRGIEPMFAFSVRETEEVAQPDGTVKKVSVFRHAGFVPAV